MKVEDIETFNLIEVFLRKFPLHHVITAFIFSFMWIPIIFILATFLNELPFFMDFFVFSRTVALCLSIFFTLLGFHLCGSVLRKKFLELKSYTLLEEEDFNTRFRETLSEISSHKASLTIGVLFGLTTAFVFWFFWRIKWAQYRGFFFRILGKSRD